MDSHIFQVLSHLYLRTSLVVHVAISPGVHLGTLTAFERKGLIQDGEQVENGGESGPRSVNQELHTHPGQDLCGELAGATE